jgi:hypothetical protein
LKNKLGSSLYKRRITRTYISERSQNERERERERERVTVLATKPLNGMNKTTMELRSPSQTRHL